MRAYRLLLRLFPKSFRHEYAGEMSAIFARRRRDAAGPWAVTLLWLVTIAETVRDACGVHADLLRQDVGYATRTLLRARGFAVTSILVMALGVGATTAVFSVADHVLVRPLPFPESARLVKLWQDDSLQGYSRLELSPAKYRDWKQMATGFSTMAAFTPASMNLTGAGLPERLEGVVATTELFSTLGVHALAWQDVSGHGCRRPPSGHSREPLCGSGFLAAIPTCWGAPSSSTRRRTSSSG